MALIAIQYREFYDLPRMFIVRYGAGTYLFDCVFDEQADDYSTQYSVYRLPESAVPRERDASWAELAMKGEDVGSVAVTSVRFDATKRASIDDSIFERLGIES
jgi:hypothetical protein